MGKPRHRCMTAGSKVLTKGNFVRYVLSVKKPIGSPVTRENITSSRKGKKKTMQGGCGEGDFTMETANRQESPLFGGKQ